MKARPSLATPPNTPNPNQHAVWRLLVQPLAAALFALIGLLPAHLIAGVTTHMLAGAPTALGAVSALVAGGFLMALSARPWHPFRWRLVNALTAKWFNEALGFAYRPVVQARLAAGTLTVTQAQSALVALSPCDRPQRRFDPRAGSLHRVKEVGGRVRTATLNNPSGESVVNPATGLPLIAGTVIDIDGNVFGSGSPMGFEHELQASSHDSFGAGPGDWSAPGSADWHSSGSSSDFGGPRF